MSTKLEEFLKELLQQIENGKLSDRISNLLGNVFLNYEMEKNGISLDSITSSDEEAMKYYVAGWFIYNKQKADKVDIATNEVE